MINTLTEIRNPFLVSVNSVDPDMKWKQFFTPVSNITGEKAKQLVADKGADNVVYLDVRQPKEYENAHLPGSRLIPMGELDRRLDELDPDSHIIVY